MHIYIYIYSHEERAHHTKEKSGSTLMPFVQLLDINYPKMALLGSVSSISTDFLFIYYFFFCLALSFSQQHSLHLHIKLLSDSNWDFGSLGSPRTPDGSSEAECSSHTLRLKCREEATQAGESARASAPCQHTWLRWSHLSYSLQKPQEKHQAEQTHKPQVTPA